MPGLEIKLHEMMARKKMRQIKELAEATKLSRTTISNLLNEKAEAIRLDTIYKLCKALDCEIGELIEIKK